MWIEFGIHFLSYWGAVYFFDTFTIQKAAWTSLYNQFTMTLPLMYLFENSYSFVVDSLTVTCYKLAGVFFLSNLLFYTVHRILHTNELYHYVHAMHHEYQDPIGVCALYAHPIEHIVANNLCFVIPVILFRLNYYWMLVLLAISSINIVWSHARVEASRSHRLHHLLYVVNYGFLDVIDLLARTYR